MAVTSATSSTATPDRIFSVEELLARAKAGISGQSEDAAEPKEPPTPVQRLLDEKAEEAKRTSTPFTEQDWYIRAKVLQLKAQISIYSTLPGLDPSGEIMKSLTNEAVALANKQKARLKEATDQAAAKQKELEEKNKPAETLTSEQLLERALARSKGEFVEDFVPTQQKILDAKEAAVNLLLKNAKARAEERGSRINTSA